MSNYFDDDAFWDGPSADPDRTSQLERVRGRSAERTRTHHVVERDDRLEPLDDGSSMWIEPSRPLTNRLGPLGSVDPRVLSVGAVALAVVLAVPLFGALGNKGSGDELRAVDQQSTTTASTVATPVTTAADVVVVTGAVDADLSGDTNGGDSATDLDEEATGDDSVSEETEAAAPQALTRVARLRQPVHRRGGRLLAAHRRGQRGVARLPARCQRGDRRDPDLPRQHGLPA